MHTLATITSGKIGKPDIFSFCEKLDYQKDNHLYNLNLSI